MNDRLNKLKTIFGDDVRLCVHRTDKSVEKEFIAFEDKYGKEVEELRKTREIQEREFDKKYGDLVITF